MQYRHKILWAALALCLLLAACSGVQEGHSYCPPARERSEGDGASVSAPPEKSGGADASVPAPPEGSVLVTDHLGRELTLQPPKRVACLIGSFTDVWLLAGGEDTLVASAGDAWTSFELDLGEGVANLGSVAEPNLELLLAAEPDFVLASVNTKADLELLDTFEELGIPAAYFQVTGFQDYLELLAACTDLTGQQDNFHRYGVQVLEQINAAKEKIDGSAPRVLYVRASGSSCKVKNSENSVLGEMLADLGCVNIADSETGLLENLSLEVILEQDPDFIFAVLQGTDSAAAEEVLRKALLSNPAWQDLTAVREGRFHILDKHLYNLKPNGRWGEAYEKLADILYP